MSINHFPWTRSDLRLDGLNRSVRQHLMTYFTLKDLARIIHVSPVFWQDFCSKRRDLLLRALKNTLGPYVTDAYAVHQTSSASFQLSRTTGTVTDFLGWFKAVREPRELIELCKEISEEDCLNMASFHNRVVQPLIERYVANASRTLDDLKVTNFMESAPLSGVEMARLYRGFYRFELACMFYGRVHIDAGENLFSGADIVQNYFRIFEPWEVQEIFCVHLFVKERYRAIVKYKDPVLRRRDKTALTSQQMKKGLISRGLYTLRVFDMNSYRGDAVEKTLVRDHQVRPRGEFLEDAWAITCQPVLRAGETQGIIARPNLSFRGDYIPYSSSEGRFPSSPWVLANGGKDYQSVGIFMKRVLYETGYVFWDFERLKGKTITELQNAKVPARG